MTLWRDAGRPQGGPMQFFHEAQKQIQVAMGDTNERGEAEQRTDRKD